MIMTYEEKIETIMILPFSFEHMYSSKMAFEKLINDLYENNLKCYITTSGIKLNVNLSIQTLFLQEVGRLEYEFDLKYDKILYFDKYEDLVAAKLILME